MAETTPTTRSPRSRAATRRLATFVIFSGSPTEVPPNFITTVPRARCPSSPWTVETVSYSAAGFVTTRLYGPGGAERGRACPALHRASAGQAPTQRHLVRVLEITPDGEAAGEPRHAGPAAQ